MADIDEFLTSILPIDTRSRNKKWYDKNGKQYARLYRKNNPSTKRNIAKTYYDKNKHRIKEKAKERYKTIANDSNFKLKQRDSHLKRTYGINIKIYNSMLSDQDGKCKICKEVKKLFVDHCHKTNKIRGLLCIKCNTGLGWYDKYLDGVKEYLGA